MIPPKYELPCEYAARSIFPSIRASIARVLVEERKLSKYAAAKILGTTPAAVSYYLEGRRGEKFTARIMSDREIMATIRRIADTLIRAHEEGDEESYRELQKLVCDICSRLNILAIKYGCPATGYKPLSNAPKASILKGHDTTV